MQASVRTPAHPRPPMPLPPAAPSLCAAHAQVEAAVAQRVERAAVPLASAFNHVNALRGSLLSVGPSSADAVLPPHLANKARAHAHGPGRTGATGASQPAPQHTAPGPAQPLRQARPGQSRAAAPPASKRHPPPTPHAQVTHSLADIIRALTTLRALLAPGEGEGGAGDGAGEEVQAAEGMLALATESSARTAALLAAQGGGGGGALGPIDVEKEQLRDEVGGRGAWACVRACTLVMHVCVARTACTSGRARVRGTLSLHQAQREV